MIYILSSDGAYRAFRGMTLDQVNGALASIGVTGAVIDAATYSLHAPAVS